MVLSFMLYHYKAPQFIVVCVESTSINRLRGYFKLFS